MDKDINSLIKEVQTTLVQSAVKDSQATKEFSDDLIDYAFDKLTRNIKSMIEEEEDPLVINEVLKGYVELTTSINDRDVRRQQQILKLHEQLVKYEQSRYW